MDTGGSSALTAVHLACAALRSGDCDLAVAGGINLSPSASPANNDSLPHAGHCNAEVNGVTRGEGCGVLVLEVPCAAPHGIPRRTYSLLLGSAICQNGASSKPMASSSVAQAAVIRGACEHTWLDPGAVGHVDTYGSGVAQTNKLHRPGEASFPTRDTADHHPRCVGNVRSDSRYLPESAGGLIKACLAAYHSALPQTPHDCRSCNDDNCHHLPVGLRHEHQVAKTASSDVFGISSFDCGGTNVQIVLMRPQPHEPEQISASVAGPSVIDSPLLLQLSAMSTEALNTLRDEYAARLRSSIDPYGTQALCAAAARCRSLLPGKRLAAAGTTPDELAAALLQAKPLTPVHTEAGHSPRVAFVFAGQGTQFVHMCAGLYVRNDIFRHALETCNSLATQHRPGQPALLGLLYGNIPDAAALLDRTEHAQPAVFAVEYAMAQVWLAWGVQPVAVAGHSLGEYVAACIAGLWTLPEAMAIVCERGRLMGGLPADTGGMLAVNLARSALVNRADWPCDGTLSIAAVNGPEAMVVAGPLHALDQLASGLRTDGIRHKRVAVSGAFHTPAMNPAAVPLAEMLLCVPTQPLCLPLISCVTGTLHAKGNAPALADPAHWRRHTEEAVHFEASVHRLAEVADLVVEISPQPTLAPLALKCQPHPTEWLPSIRSRPAKDTSAAPRDDTLLLQTIADTAAYGAVVVPPSANIGTRPAAVAQALDVLPLYPFQHTHRGSEPPSVAPSQADCLGGGGTGKRAGRSAAVTADKRDFDATATYSHDAAEAVTRAWRSVLGHDPPAPTTDFFEAGGTSLTAMQLEEELRHQGFEISTRAILEQPTLAAIVKTLQDKPAACIPSRQAASCVREKTDLHANQGQGYSPTTDGCLPLSAPLREVSGCKEQQEDASATSIQKDTVGCNGGFRRLPSTMVLQAVGVALLVAAGTLPALLLLSLVLRVYSCTGSTILAIACVPLAWLGYGTALLGTSVVLQRLLIGTNPAQLLGAHSVHSGFYLRWWFCDRLRAATVAYWLHPLLSTPLASAYLRLLGACVGKHVHLGSLEVGMPAATELGDDVMIGNNAHVANARIQGEWFVVAPVRVGSRATLGFRSVAVGGSSVEEGATLAPLSATVTGQQLKPEAYYLGSPARPSQDAAAARKRGKAAVEAKGAEVWQTVRQLLGACVVHGVIAASAAVAAHVALWTLQRAGYSLDCAVGESNCNDVSLAMTGYSGRQQVAKEYLIIRVSTCIAIHPALLFLAAAQGKGITPLAGLLWNVTGWTGLALAAVSFFFAFGLCLACSVSVLRRGLLRFAVLARRRSLEAPLADGAYRVYSYEAALRWTSMYAVKVATERYFIYLGSTPYYALLLSLWGAKIDRGTRLARVIVPHPETLEIGEHVFVGGQSNLESELQGTASDGRRTTTIMSLRLSRHSFVGGFAHAGPAALQPLAEGTLVGACTVAPASTEQGCWSTYVGVPPLSMARTGGETAAQTATFGLGVKAWEHVAYAAVFAWMAVAACIAAVAAGATLAWAEKVGGMLGLMLALPLAHATQLLALVLLYALVKRVFFGRLLPHKGMHGASWGTLGLQLLKRLQLLADVHLVPVVGTAAHNGYLWLQGLRTGSQVYFGTVNPVTEPDLAEVGAGAVLSAGAVLWAHAYCNWHMQLGRVRVGRNAWLGENAVMAAGTVVHDGALLCAASYAMAGTQVKSGTTAVGSPASVGQEEAKDKQEHGGHSRAWAA